jgi:RNA polymerase sigma-70 factor (ECF subfamily)
VFVRVFRTLHSYQGERTGFRTWLRSVTRNLLIDDYRRNRRSPRTLSYDSADEQTRHIVHSVPCRGSNPEARFERQEQRAAVSRALRLLNPELRQAVILRDVKGLTYREVSEQLMTPLGTAKSRVNRGRIELLRLLRQGTAFSHHFDPNASAAA